MWMPSEPHAALAPVASAAAAGSRHPLPNGAVLRPPACRQVAKLPRWQSTLTLRALLIGALLGGCFCIISLKLSLTTGGG